MQCRQQIERLVGGDIDGGRGAVAGAHGQPVWKLCQMQYYYLCFSILFLLPRLLSPAIFFLAYFCLFALHFV